MADLIFSQKTGELRDGADGRLLGVCQSGHGLGTNNPFLDSADTRAPIPEGLYRLGAPDVSDSVFPILPLTPLIGNAMHGRRGFVLCRHAPPVPDEAARCAIFAPVDILTQAAEYHVGDLLAVVSGLHGYSSNIGRPT